jgi:hypothetical protein
MSDPDGPESRYEDNVEFNEYLDSLYGTIEIAGSEFPSSKVLFAMEYETYIIALQDFHRDRIESFKEIVIDQFPAPIAMCYYRFENGFENDFQRLNFLRDTWESIINLIHALVVSEFRCKKISIDKSSIKFGTIFTDKLAEKLLNIERLLQYASKNGLEMISADMIPVETIMEMRELNRKRNGFSHIGTLSDDQARKIIAETEEQVLTLLRDLEKLKELHLIRYLGQEINILNIKHERFDGYAMTRTVKVLTIKKDNLIDACRFLCNNQILATNGEWIISLKPFVHFLKSDSGHLSKICFLKKKGESQPDPKFIFEVIGEAVEIPLSRVEFSSEIDELRSLFGLTSDT